MTPGFALSALKVIMRHPSLWATAVGLAFRLARPGWWRRRPFLPVPDDEYLRFRLETQYGSGREPVAEDLVPYLRWVRRTRRSR